MKQTIYHLLLVLALALSANPVVAQPATVKVTFRGNSPTINDFVASLARAYKGNAEFSDFANDVRGGTRNFVNVKIVSDGRNGYASREVESGYDASVNKTEMCYWNCANKREKIVAVNMVTRNPDGIDDCYIAFYRYDNAKRVMKKIPAPFDREVKPIDFTKPLRTRPERINYARNVSGEDANSWAPIFSLPQIGKDIEITIADGMQLQLSERQWLRYVWNGNGFTLTLVD
ncbi:MAG: hypothetical protein SOZ80_00205 [Prevotella sp.]|uniref:hypothetical protein n=1 Tax=Prevotella sp. TaxID=59823 RepID=UPI002A2C5559|nr:hypothetical protein [Prevotella sp.]MDD7317472.1 hypothetical protein [Prevotellaceae bacterium]MDY4019192.1 hypothetical protein [Prevotella sp.]